MWALVVALLATASTQAQEGGGDPAVEPVPFEGCGYLVQSEHETGSCFSFVTHNGRFSLEDIGDFGDGDAVCVIGELVASPCGVDCGDINGCIVNATIVPAYDGSGSMLEDPDGCGAFESFTGERFKLTTWIPAGLADGDPVNVIGLLVNDCMTACDTPCIEMPFVMPAEVATGTLVIAPGECPRVVSDDGSAVAIGNEGDFQPGDRVYVAGRLRSAPSLCSDATMPALPDNAIAELFEVCGEVFDGPDGCLMLVTEDDRSFFIDPHGGLVASNIVHVAGVADHAGAPSCEDAESLAIKVMSSRPCLAGDVTLDGVVDIDDLIAIIIAWGSGDYRADLTGDGVVDIDDLVTSLLNWG